MADSDHLYFNTSPSGADAVEVVWLLPNAGLFGRDKVVPRSQATHARILEVGGTSPCYKVVTAIDANAYIAQIQQLVAEREEARATVAREREEWLATLVSECGRCDTVREYAGRQAPGGNVAGAAMVPAITASVSGRFHVYVCPRCGSIEQFADGAVPHPLVGNRLAPKTS